MKITHIDSRGIHFSTSGSTRSIAPYDWQLPEGAQITGWHVDDETDAVVVEYQEAATGDEETQTQTATYDQATLLQVADDSVALTDSEQLEIAKRQAKTQLKRNRHERLGSGFEFQGKQIQTRHGYDDRSNITNVGVAAMVDPNFTTEFITADNTTLQLDADGAKALYGAMLQAGQAVYATYIAKRGEIEAATTIGQVEGVDLSL